jgi:hypothetical protein
MSACGETVEDAAVVYSEWVSRCDVREYKGLSGFFVQEGALADIEASEFGPRLDPALELSTDKRDDSGLCPEKILSDSDSYLLPLSLVVPDIDELLPMVRPTNICTSGSFPNGGNTRFLQYLA